MFRKLSAQEANMRVILVDDNLLFLETLAAQLAHTPRTQIVGRANSGSEGLRLARELKPDVAIVDLAMPDMNGLELAHSLKQLASPPRVVMLSMYDEPEYREGALLMGVDAYIAKHNVHAELLPLLHRLHAELLPPVASAADTGAAHPCGFNH